MAAEFSEFVDDSVKKTKNKNKEVKIIIVTFYFQIISPENNKLARGVLLNSRHEPSV